MAANWGVIEQRDDYGVFIAYHIMPMVDIDGEAHPSGAHGLTKHCHCKPNLEHGTGGWDIWNHHDAEHPGSRENEKEYLENKARESSKNIKVN
jgi:hypothetical protein